MTDIKSAYHISAQVWVCDACGGQDAKTCGCNSSAHMKALKEAAAKHAERKERDRQYQRAKRAESADAHIETVDESPKANGTPRPLPNWNRGPFCSNKDDFVARAAEAKKLAAYTGLATEEVVKAAQETVEAWQRLFKQLHKEVYAMPPDETTRPGKARQS